MDAFRRTRLMKDMARGVLVCLGLLSLAIVVTLAYGLVWR